MIEGRNQCRNSHTLQRHLFFCICFSHVQQDAHLGGLGELTLCRWEETIFKLSVCKTAPKWQHCHCCFCSKHPIKLAVYTFLPDSCLPTQKGWAANEVQHREQQERWEVSEKLQTQPSPVAKQREALPGWDPSQPPGKEGHTWVVPVPPNRLWAKPSPDSFSRRLI